jgi:hypothetical protein
VTENANTSTQLKLEYLEKKAITHIIGNKTSSTMFCNDDFVATESYETEKRLR